VYPGVCDVADRNLTLYVHPRHALSPFPTHCAAVVDIQACLQHGRCVVWRGAEGSAQGGGGRGALVSPRSLLPDLLFPCCPTQQPLCALCPRCCPGPVALHPPIHGGAWMPWCDMHHECDVDAVRRGCALHRYTVCNEVDCTDGCVFATDWSDWGPCSAPCGGGYQIRWVGPVWAEGVCV
jgi:hypothetical protein